MREKLKTPPGASISERTRLLYGPYHSPEAREGQKIVCVRDGLVTVCGFLEGLIPWPYTVSSGGRRAILCGDLMKAIRHEGRPAIAHHFGVHSNTVTAWRRLLCVKRPPAAPRELTGRPRGRPPRVDLSRIDFRKSNAQLAHQFDVTLQAVRNWRRAAGKPAVAAMFRDFVRSNRDRLHGLLRSEAVNLSGIDISAVRAGAIMRQEGLGRAYRSVPHLVGADWRLGNTDLAEVWGGRPATIGEYRRNHGKPVAKWNRHLHSTRNDPAYHEALRGEHERRQTAAPP